jgi:hypothetical protein
MDAKGVVEAARREVTDVRLDREGFHALLNQSSVPAREAGQIRDAGDLEPVQIDRVVRDPLRVRLAEAHR